MIYCDYAATTPMSEQALTMYQTVARKYYGNASSLHDTGSKAQDILEQARTILARSLGVDASRLFFTSGGTESNILAIDTILRSAPPHEKKHIITSTVEHSSIYYYLKQMDRSEMIDVTFLACPNNGSIDMNELARSIQSNTCLVSIQHVNSETGIQQPIEEIGKLLRTRNIAFHSDFVQSFGKIKIDLSQLPVDAISISSHKIYGPKGVGAVYFHPSIFLKPHPISTNHEKGIRPGTVDVAGIAAFVTAVEEMNHHLDQHFYYLKNIQHTFIDQIRHNKTGLTPIFVGESMHCPSIVGCISDHTQGDYLMLEYNRFGIAISTGSACGLGQSGIPRSIQPFIQDEEEGRRFIRFSFSHLTTEEDLEMIIRVSKQIGEKFVEV